jgi:hypothetical protein
MIHLDAYHLSNQETKADREERIRRDKTCMDCGFVDEKANGHDCPTRQGGE